MMDKLTEAVIIPLIKEHWYRPRALILLNATLLIATLIFLYQFDFLYILNFTSQEVKYRITIIEFAIPLIPLIIATLIWFMTTSAPKNKKGIVGIIVAILTENESEKIRLKNDFIKLFQEKINAGGKQKTFNIIEYPEYHSYRVNGDTVNSYLNKSRAHFIIYGFLKKRFHEGKENYFFHLNIVVRHAPIPIDISKVFSKEMDLISPLNVCFVVENEFKGFEITKDWAVFATEYIIGVASFLTGDFALSSTLHLNLYNELKSIKTTLPAIREIRQRNKVRLIETLFQIFKFKYHEYRRTGKNELLNTISDVLNTIKSIEPKNYGANLARAIFYFVRDRDVSKALKELRMVPYKSNDTWRYSEAFLYAYRGDMDKAINSYRKAFRGIVEPHVPDESEEFIHDILKVEPEKCQLWFCLGLINFFAKEDHLLAKQDFERFLACGNESNFQEQKRLAREYLKQIKL